MRGGSDGWLLVWIQQNIIWFQDAGGKRSYLIKHIDVFLKLSIMVHGIAYLLNELLLYNFIHSITEFIRIGL